MFKELCYQLITARDEGSMTMFWAAVGRIAQAVENDKTKDAPLKTERREDSEGKVVYEHY